MTAASMIQTLGCLCAATAVIFGAFGAHALSQHLTANALNVYETGVQYHFWHSLAVLFVTLQMQRSKQRALVVVAWMFLSGIFLFSGSLYLLACREWLGITHWRWLGPITPIGGTLFIAAWLYWAFLAWKAK